MEGYTPEQAQVIAAIHVCANQGPLFITVPDVVAETTMTEAQVREVIAGCPMIVIDDHLDTICDWPDV
jgi:hypothetical protein